MVVESVSVLEEREGETEGERRTEGERETDGGRERGSTSSHTRTSPSAPPPGIGGFVHVR